MRRLLLRLALASLLAALAGGRGGAEEIPSELFGRPVEAIAFTCDGPASLREVEALVALRVGRPLNPEETAATIRNLFGTRDFSNILVEAEPSAGGGVAVTIHLWRAYRVRKIDLEGKYSPSREDMRRAIPFSEGDPFNAGAIAGGASALERRLGTDGYLHPVVEPEVTFDEASFAVTVVYGIEAGSRARVAPAFYDGSIEPFAAGELQKTLKLKVGSAYRESKARSDAERLRKFLLEQSHFRASVELIAAEPTEEGAIRPVYRIAVGPRCVIEATGLKEKQVRREILALLENQGFDEDLLQQWTDTTREGLQRQGRYRAQVSAAAAGTDPVTVRVAVDPGAKYAVEQIAFSGNASVSEEALRGLIVTRKKGIPFLQKGTLLDGELEGDARAILGYYQARGWIGARVEKPSVAEGSKPGLLDLTFRMEEGPRTFVASRSVEGAEHLAPADVESLLTLREGQPFDPNAVRQDVGALAAYYANSGWREVAVKDRATLSDDRTKADVVYTVDEGMRTFFGKTIVRGNAVTRPERIARQVAWKEGEPFSEAKIAETQRNLARSGVFRSIEVRPQPVDPDSQSHNVDIDLAEARRLSLLYGVGYQYSPGATSPNDPFVTLGLSYRNLFGRMQTASFEVQYAPISGRGYVVANYLEPYLFGTDVPLTAAVFASREPIQEVNYERLGMFVESVRLFGHLRVGLRYSYQHIQPEDPQDLGTIVLEKFPRSAFPIKQSAIGPSFLYDWRDDVLDPHKGYYVTVAGNYAFPFLNATAHYGKVSGQAAWFKQIFRGVLAASVRVGGLFPVGTLGAQNVPIPEKFFAGGSSTARGFDTDLEGIPQGPTTPPGGGAVDASDITLDYNTQATPISPDSGMEPCASLYPTQAQQNPILAQYDCSPGPRIVGGNGFMAVGLEYRYPILGNLGISVFYDLAQVWATPGKIRLALEGTDGLRQSIGIGIHYMTPIGPLRLEVGRPVQLRDVNFAITATENPDGSKCDPSPCVLVPNDKPESPTIKETGRIFLSIGYPF